MKVHQTLEWLNLLSLGTKGLKPRQQSVRNQGSVTGGGWRGQHLNSQFYAPLFEIWVSFRVKRSSHAPSDSPVTAACTAQKLLLNACEIVVKRCTVNYFDTFYLKS